jgi:hypothetical protein
MVIPFLWIASLAANPNLDRAVPCLGGTKLPAVNPARTIVIMDGPA